MTRFEEFYRAGPVPWDIGRPQPVFVRLADDGEIVGTVLDVGCGTGDNAIELARRGFDVTAIDAAPTAIERARAKAENKGISVRFLNTDALSPDLDGARFQTVIDSGLFHVFSDEERPLFEKMLAEKLEPGGSYFLLCFSEHETRPDGPRRVTQTEIKGTFQKGWRVHSIETALFDNVLYDSGARAWLAKIERMDEEPGASPPSRLGGARDETRRERRLISDPPLPAGLVGRSYFM
ncbi:MAG: class I SAM-dependent methyltransferase [Deltaproteobacteria bacterium]|nr:class I SAM-dependent methyltransferase [Deltaproteobacteria bacterium]